MATSRLAITHPDITRASLDAYLSRQCADRARSRIAILRGVMDRVPINHLSWQRKMSRQGIYNLVNRVNRKGLRGLKDQHIDRPGKLMVEIAEDLKRTLINSPTDQGYIERHWNNVLLRRYLNEKHGVDIGRAKLMNWISAIGIPVKLARKRYEKTAAAERSTLVTDLRKIQNHKLKEIIIYGNEAGAEVDVVLIAQWTPEVCPPDMFTGDRR